MEYRRLGETEIIISAVTFGSWAAGGWMWGGTERKDAIEAITEGFDRGVTTIDTAPIYGQGLSEEIVGEAVKLLPRDKVQILTKFGMRWDTKKGDFAFKSKNNSGGDIDIYKYSGGESIVKECEDSLRRLKTDYIDLYQIHWPDSTTLISESMEAVLRLKEQGKIREAGVCNFNIQQMSEAEEVLSIASNQVSYSMLKPEIEQELVPYCLTHKKSILAYSPLERGLLSGKIKPGHSFAEGDHRAFHYLFKPENVRKVNLLLDKLSDLATSKNAVLSEIVINWTINKPGITSALVGARNSQQAILNAKAAELNLTAEEMLFIESELTTFRNLQ